MVSSEKLMYEKPLLVIIWDYAINRNNIDRVPVVIIRH